VSGVGLAMWPSWAPNRLGSTGPAHDGLRRTGPETAGLVHGGPRPSLPLLPSAHGAPIALSSLGTVAPSSLCLAVALLAGGELMRSRAMVAWRGCIGCYGIMGPWRTRQGAKRWWLRVLSGWHRRRGYRRWCEVGSEGAQGP
jgi:hypothetical protein